MRTNNRIIQLIALITLVIVIGLLFATGVDAQGNGFTRLSGPTRIETSIAASQGQWPDCGMQTINLANGHATPDALVADTSRGPVLYTNGANDITPGVLNEIERCAPVPLTVFGGPSVVSDRVAGLAADAASGKD